MGETDDRLDPDVVLLSSSGECDFCYVDHAPWTLPARPFLLPGTVDTLSVGDWHACLDCATLIRADRWDDLVTRAVRMFVEHRGPCPNGEASLAVLYRALRKHRTGPMRRNDDTDADA